MKKLKKQIKESFFNPILHFLPLFTFLVIDEYFGIDMAWKLSFPIALTLLVYIFFALSWIFTWHLLFTAFYLIVGILTGLISLIELPQYIHNLEGEFIVLLFFALALIFRKQFQKSVLRIMHRLMPMTNNFDELFRVIWLFSGVLAVYIAGTLLIQHFVSVDTDYNFMLLTRTLYVGVLCFLVVYEIMRVIVIRSNLSREEWWPIVNEHGKIIGRIQHSVSLLDEKKYTHPIVRVLIIDKGLIFLQKRATSNVVFGGLWDTAISNHLTVGETIEQCVERTARERYSLNNFRYMHLSNYTIENKYEQHYAFLFVSCQLATVQPNPKFVERTKWWTQQQIEENLDSGIFTENFKTEYDLLKRSGLLESGKCECKCRLKEVIYEQSGLSKGNGNSPDTKAV